MPLFLNLLVMYLCVSLQSDFVQLLVAFWQTWTILIRLKRSESEKKKQIATHSDSDIRHLSCFSAHLIKFLINKSGLRPFTAKGLDDGCDKNQ